MIAATERSGDAAALKAIAGDYDAAGADRAATLTTVVIDNAGDYVLENERSHDNDNRERLRTRPARPTTAAPSTGRRGRQRRTGPQKRKT